MATMRVAVAVAVLIFAGCTQGSETSQEKDVVCVPAPSSRPSKDLGIMIGSGLGRPVVNSHDGEVDFAQPDGSTDLKGEWGGNKILWAVAPGTGEVTVRGHEVGGEGKLRFGAGAHPKADLVLAAPPRATDWSDFPGYTRARSPGCYAFEVTSPSGTEQIVFHFA